MFGISIFVAWLLSQCVEHAAWTAGVFLVRVTVWAARRAFSTTGRAVRAWPGLVAAVECSRRMLELYSCSHTPPRLFQPRTRTPKVHAARQLQRWPPRAPKRRPRRARGLAVLVVAWMVNGLLYGADASPTAARVQRARAILESTPLPPTWRAEVNALCVSRSNVAFLGNCLDANATCELACDLGQPDPSAVALFDTGAAVHASIGKLPVLKGSVEANHLWISTANGLTLPPTKCTQLLKCRQRGAGGCNDSSA
eukprot:593073-Prymnesium_polylepis.4